MLRKVHRTGSSIVATLAALVLVAGMSPAYAADADEPGGPDWTWRGSAQIFDDGEKDATAYGQGASEDTKPEGWGSGTSSSPNNDILQYYVNVDATDDVVASFGFTRKAINGDTAFSVEFNQEGNYDGAPARPKRAPGDLLLKFHVSGNAPLQFRHAYLWTPESGYAAHRAEYPGFQCQTMYDGLGWCEIPRDGFAGRVADGGFTAEAKVNLTALYGDHGCSAVFNTINPRSHSSAENFSNSLKDYVGPLAVQVPSTCSTLVIKKLRAGTDTPVPGAKFDVYKGAGTDGTPWRAGVTDGGDGTITLTDVEPGTYTVVEVAPPAGYFLPADPVQTSQVGKSTTVTFTFEDVKKWQPLEVTKTSVGSYDLTHDWDIEKGVGDTEAGPFDPEKLEKRVADDGEGDTAADFGFEVKVTQGARKTSDIEVTGQIKVQNPNDEPVTVDLTDQLAGAECAVTGGSRQVAAPGTNAFGYTCTYPDGTEPAELATTNVATATWSKADYPVDVDGDNVLDADEAEGEHSVSTDPTTVDYSVNEVGRTVTVTDDKHEWSPAWTMTWTGAGVTETRTYTRSISAPAGASNTEKNTAHVHSGDTELARDDATAVLKVGKDLEISKVSAQSLVRSYLWDIEKTSADQGPVFVGADGKATAKFNLKLSAQNPDGKGDAYEDSDWKMSGTITVKNPNRWQAVALTGLSDEFSGGGTCTIDGWAGMTAADRTIPADGRKDFDYTCAFSEKPAYTGTNTATATWDAAAAHTPNGTSSYDLVVDADRWELASERNVEVEVWDDVQGDGAPAVKLPGGPYTWSEGFSVDIPVEVELGAPDGECKVWTNVGSVRNGQVALDTDGADVTVCNPADLTVSKEAHGSFDRTYLWDLDKRVSADPESDKDSWGDRASWSGAAGSHEFGYHVVLRQDGFSDAAWRITGTITLQNTNADPRIPAVSSTLTDTPDVGAAGTCTVVGGPDDGEPLSGYRTAAIPSGDSLSIDYECTFTGKPRYTGGKNVVTATNAVNSPATAPVSFTRDGETDRTVKVYDNLADPTAQVPVLFEATYDESTPDKTHAKGYTLEHTADGIDCTDFVNTAAAYGDSAVVPVAPYQKATATICTPHFTLAKSSDVGATVLPPYLGDPGDTITYTLRAHNDSEAVIDGATMPGAKVVDDLSDVLDNATLVEGSISGPGTATLDGTVLTWLLPELQPGETVELSYQVTVDADQWDQTLRNTATPSGGGDCADEDGCETTTSTPAPTQLQVRKVDAETGEELAGAEFDLYQDNAPFADSDDPVVGPEDELIDSATSGEDGSAVFDVRLLPGNFLVRETRAPDGYDLPAWGDTMAVVIDGQNYVPNGVMAALEFRDPAQGGLSLTKAQFELDPMTGLWVPSDGVVEHGDQVRYVVDVAAEGRKRFRDVTVTDHVPGFDPEDTTSTARASLVPGSATCSAGLTCTVSVVDGLVTWELGDLRDVSGSVEMVVTFPDVPLDAQYDENDQFTTTLQNVAYLGWQETVFSPDFPEGVAVDNRLPSNAVVATATVTQPPTLPPLAPPAETPPTQQSPEPAPLAPQAAPPQAPTALPNTGGPEAWLPLTGIGLLVLGGALLLARARHGRFG